MCLQNDNYSVKRGQQEPLNLCSVRCWKWKPHNNPKWLIALTSKRESHNANCSAITHNAGQKFVKGTSKWEAQLFKGG